MPDSQLRTSRREAAQRRNRQERNERRLKFFAAVGAVIAMALGLIVFWPKLTVEAGRFEFDPSNPHPLPFVISNIGFIQLRDVQPTIKHCLVAMRAEDTLPQPPHAPICNDE